MDTPSKTAWTRARKRIAAKVKSLRSARGWTQRELGERLHITQGHLSKLEHGEASFTAEQFLEILKLFNVTTTYFTGPAPEHHLTELQNALARHGAAHLREDDRLVPSESLDDVALAVERALVSGEARLVTAVAPVLVRHAGVIHLQALAANLARAGLQRRLWWVVESTIEAIDHELPTVTSRKQANVYRRAKLVLRTYLDSVGAPSATEDYPLPDVVDPIVRTSGSLAQLMASAHAPATFWNIATRIQTRDFIKALREAHVGR